MASATSVARLSVKRPCGASDYPCSGVMIGVCRKAAAAEKSTSEVGRPSTASSPAAESRSTSMTFKGARLREEVANSPYSKELSLQFAPALSRGEGLNST